MATRDSINNLNHLKKDEELPVEDVPLEEVALHRSDISDLAQEHIESKGIALELINEQILRIDVPGEALTSSVSQIGNIHISSPYGLKGGGARAVLEDLLDLPAVNIRDIDIVRLTSFSSPEKNYSGEDAKLAQEYMPDDFSHGHGVDVQSDIYSYLNNRDFTRNEIIVLPSGGNYELYCTKDCLADTFTGSIELSEYEKDSEKGKLFAKAVRWYATEKAQGRDISLGDIGASESVRSFDVALQLDRIEDAQVARIFAHKLYELEVMALEDWELPDTLSAADEVEHLREQLAEYLNEGLDFFRTQLRDTPDINEPWEELRFKYEEDL